MGRRDLGEIARDGSPEARAHRSSNAPGEQAIFDGTDQSWTSPVSSLTKKSALLPRVWAFSLSTRGTPEAHAQ
ncbi:hypothetical protein BHS06_29720 [Myxococcus xanthus]|nr:hypothetical protein BHS06_29720 [Myxococcus xanthus]